MASTAKQVVRVVDLFSGCGGLSAGFQMARTSNVQYELAAAMDVDSHANATYQSMLGVKPDEQDVSVLMDVGFLRSKREEWRSDSADALFLVGGPPCQGFSSHRKKDVRKDVRNSLVGLFAEVAVRVDADVVVMENVPEMFHRRHWAHFDAFRSTLEAAGYKVRAQVHNLAAFGVPQERYRAVVVAARDWDSFSMPKPIYAPHEYQTVRQAIGHLRPLKAGEVDRDDPMHRTSRHRSETVELIKLIPLDGGSRSALPEGVGLDCWEGVDGFRDVYGRMSWDKPANAITARCRTPSTGRFVHPSQHRGLTVREAALLQGFPESWMFEGPFDDKFKQIGNAVSPIYATALAQHLDEEWAAEHGPDVAESTSRYDITQPLSKSFSSSIAALKRKQIEEGAQLTLI